MSSLTLTLAGLAAGLCRRDLTEAAADWATRAFTDTLACALAGTGTPVAQLAGSVLSAAPGPCQVFGSVDRLHPLDAAQRNGIAAHALDYDDCNLEMDGHPSVSIVPALFALAEARNKPGSEVLTAFVAGLEVEIRLARIANPAHAERGWHPTVTFGVIGAAVACGRLIGLDQERLAIAMAIAASSAAGLRANSGTMTKPFHAGQANRNGLQAALLAEAGFTARDTALEHRFGFLKAFGGSDDPDIEPAIRGWGRAYALLSPGIAVKQYPCCAFVHCAIDAAASLRAEIGATLVTEVEVVLNGKRLGNIDRPRPTDGLDAKFSTQYLTARALIDGAVGLGDFTPDRLGERDVTRLAEKVTLRAHDDDLSLGHVHVSLEDGRRLTASARVAMGRDPANPMTTSEFRRKFDDCVSHCLMPAQGEALFTILMSLDQHADFAPVSEAVAGAADRAALQTVSSEE
ncbi:MmgE/PrpD family protein [Martelella soudanensis]|uniref:MmgE/PrpD family protein n=1 Tax=unclassified Martelella TaxID=2629616 RepID=UPI0015DDE3A2|nr:MULTISPECIES: MmgE/PrpD family protein [unclassified Martelella]